MSTIFGGTPVPNDLANALIDLQWEALGVQNGISEANLIATALTRSVQPSFGAQASGNCLQLLTGGAVTVVREATTGIRVIQVTSGAGTRTSRLFGTVYTIPSGAQFGGVVPSYRRMRRYRAGALVMYPVRGASVLETGLVFGNGYLTFLGTAPAFVLSSDPAVNAGRWTARVRQVDAGAITTLNDTGILPSATAFQYYEVQYTEGPVPLLELLINGVTVASISGLASVPATTGVALAGAFGFGISIVAGTTMQYAALRYRVEEI